MKNKINETIYKYKKIIFILLIIIIIVIIQIINKDKSNKTNIIKAAENIIEIEKPVIEQNKETTPSYEQKKIKIDIKGEVLNPGVYELNEGDRVIEAVNISGGLTNDADTTLINLSKNLKDEMVIIIYNKYEIDKLKEEKNKKEVIIEYIEKECECPDNINDACITDNKESEEKEESKEENNKKISLNEGTLEELMTIPGIGETKAQSIIEYRTQNKEFKTIEEIKNIKGIGESTFEKLKDFITI